MVFKKMENELENHLLLQFSLKAGSSPLCRLALLFLPSLSRGQAPFPLSPLACLCSLHSQPVRPVGPVSSHLSFPLFPALAPAGSHRPSQS